MEIKGAIMDIKSFEQTEFITALNNTKMSSNDLNVSIYGYAHPHNFDAPCFIESGFAVHFITKGSVLFTANGKTTKLSKNSCFVLLPNKSSSYVAVKSSSNAHYWVTFHGKESINFLKLIGFDIKQPHIKLDPLYAKKLRKHFFKFYVI